MIGLKLRGLNFLIFFLIGSHFNAVLPAQTISGSQPDYWLDEVVVVADRSPGLLIDATWATSILSQSSLKQLPARNLAEALQYLPGLTFVERDGSGNMPMAIVRGFFGGGEAEYILLMVNGVQVNDLRTGLVEWSQIPLASVERIEVLRGGGSAIYGDAALGAAINVITSNMDSEKKFSTNLKLGQQGERRSTVNFQTYIGNHVFSLNATEAQSDGFRAHSQWSNLVLDGRYDFKRNDSQKLYLKWNLSRTKNDDPGPLTRNQIKEDRKQSNPFFEQDQRQRDQFQTVFGYRNHSDNQKNFSVDFGIRRVEQDQTRTLLLTPLFSNSQFHDENHFTYWTNASYNFQASSLAIITGIDAEYGNFKSQYRHPIDKNLLLSEGSGNRIKSGIYLEAQQKISDRLRTTGGVRYDIIRSTNDQESVNKKTSTFRRLTPRLGINFAYMSEKQNSGRIYANFSQSFKAPTIDQLFDQRKIAAGVFGEYNFSNSTLKPQRSTSFEMGLYQRLPLLYGRLTGEFNLTAYRIDLKDEIDFDLNTFKYGNIQRSRHNGFEGTATLYFSPTFSLNSSFNFVDVTFRSGENKTNKLKNIPNKSIATSLNFYFTNEFQSTITYRSISQVFLDDSNDITLPGYHTFDAKFQWKTKFGRIYILGFNLSNSHHNSSGYILFDPNTFQNVPFLFPSQGRNFQSGIEFSL